MNDSPNSPNFPAIRYDYNYISYKFCSPLSSLLLNQRCLKQFVISLQTRSLLHEVHLHFTESELICPSCNKRCMSDFVSQCSIVVENIPFMNEPGILILFHNMAPTGTVVFKVLSDVCSSCNDDVNVCNIYHSQVEHRWETKVWIFILVSFIKRIIILQLSLSLCIVNLKHSW